MAEFESYYNIHGHTARLITNSPAIATAAGEALAGFGPVAGSGRAALEIQLDGVEAGTRFEELPSSAQLLRRVEGGAEVVPFALFRDDARYYLDFGATGRMCLDAEAGRLGGWLTAPDANPPDWAASFVLLAAIELLRLRGVYSIHAAGLETGGHGVLLAGPSGSGKTTACLALLRAGYRYLSDDHPLLRADGADFELLPFPGRPAVSDWTSEWFPELANLRQDSVKRSFRVEDVFASGLGKACRPALLLFLRIADWPESVVERLTPARALEELLPLTLLALDPERAAQQFHTMAELVRRTPCFRLHFGENVTELPALLAPLLEESIWANVTTSRS